MVEEYWLAVDISDNDFWRTGEESLRNIGVSYQNILIQNSEYWFNRSDLFFDKKKIASVMNYLMKVMYVVHQNPFADDDLKIKDVMDDEVFNDIDWELSERHIAIGYDDVERLQKECMFYPETFDKYGIYNRNCNSSLCIMHVTINEVKVFTL